METVVFRGKNFLIRSSAPPRLIFRVFANSRNLFPPPSVPRTKMGTERGSRFQSRRSSSADLILDLYYPNSRIMAYARIGPEDTRNSVYKKSHNIMITGTLRYRTSVGSPVTLFHSPATVKSAARNRYAVAHSAHFGTPRRVFWIDFYSANPYHSDSYAPACEADMCGCSDTGWSRGKEVPFLSQRGWLWRCCCWSRGFTSKSQAAWNP